MTFDTYADCRVVRVKGRADHTNADRFHDELTSQAHEVPQGGGMVVDLSELEFITSAGLRALLVAKRTLSASGAQLVVCGLKGVVKEVFRIASFDALLSVAGSTEQAVRQISAEAAEAYPG